MRIETAPFRDDDEGRLNTGVMKRHEVGLCSLREVGGGSGSGGGAEVMDGEELERWREIQGIVRGSTSKID